MGEGDRGTERPFSPRNAVRSEFSPTLEDVREEDLVVERPLRSGVGEEFHPGSVVTSENRPNAAPVPWAQGDMGAVISDQAALGSGILGAMGALLGWPGRRHPGAGRFLVTQFRREFAELLRTHIASSGRAVHTTSDGVRVLSR